MPIDSALTSDQGVTAQPMATVLSALSTLPNVVGLTVAVVGQGPIGLLFDAGLAHLGATRISGIDVDVIHPLYRTFDDKPEGLLTDAQRAAVAAAKAAHGL